MTTSTKTKKSNKEKAASFALEHLIKDCRSISGIDKIDGLNEILQNIASSYEVIYFSMIAYKPGEYTSPKNRHGYNYKVLKALAVAFAQTYLDAIKEIVENTNQLVKESLATLAEITKANAQMLGKNKIDINNPEMLNNYLSKNLYRTLSRK